MYFVVGNLVTEIYFSNKKFSSMHAWRVECFNQGQTLNQPTYSGHYPYQGQTLNQPTYLGHYPYQDQTLYQPTHSGQPPLFAHFEPYSFWSVYKYIGEYNMVLV